MAKLFAGCKPYASMDSASRKAKDSDALVVLVVHNKGLIASHQCSYISTLLGVNIEEFSESLVTEDRVRVGNLQIISYALEL